MSIHCRNWSIYGWPDGYPAEPEVCLICGDRKVTEGVACYRQRDAQDGGEVMLMVVCLSCVAALQPEQRGAQNERR